MRLRTARGLGVFGLVAALALTGCQADAGDDAAGPGEPITLATTPIGDDPTAQNPVEAFADLLSQTTGRKVEITDVPDYLSVVEAIRADHVDIGLMSGFPSALAVDTGEVDALLAWPGDGKPVSTCVVLDDSPVSALEELRGKTVAFADQASSSGYFMPVHMLHRAGLRRDTDYEAIFAGGHEGSFAALEQGQVDAACTAVMLTEMAGSDMFPFEKGEFRTVGKSEPMAVSLSVLARQSLDQETRELLQEALPKVLAPGNADRLGPLAEAAGTKPVVNPGPELFRPFVDIAAVAGVEMGDLG